MQGQPQAYDLVAEKFSVSSATHPYFFKSAFFISYVVERKIERMPFLLLPPKIDNFIES